MPAPPLESVSRGPREVHRHAHGGEAHAAQVRETAPEAVESDARLGEDAEPTGTLGSVSFEDRSPIAVVGAAA